MTASGPGSSFEAPVGSAREPSGELGVERSILIAVIGERNQLQRLYRWQNPWDVCWRHAVSASSAGVSTVS